MAQSVTSTKVSDLTAEEAVKKAAKQHDEICKQWQAVDVNGARIRSVMGPGVSDVRTFMDNKTQKAMYCKVLESRISFAYFVGMIRAQMIVNGLWTSLLNENTQLRTVVQWIRPNNLSAEQTEANSSVENFMQMIKQTSGRNGQPDLLTVEFPDKELFPNEWGFIINEEVFNTRSPLFDMISGRAYNREEWEKIKTKHLHQRELDAKLMNQSRKKNLNTAFNSSLKCKDMFVEAPQYKPMITICANWKFKHHKHQRNSSSSSSRK